MGKSKEKQAEFFYLFFGSDSWKSEDEDISVSLHLNPNCSSDVLNLVNSPRIGITIYNKSDDVIYIDLGRTFLRRNNTIQIFWEGGINTDYGTLSPGLIINNYITGDASRLLAVPPFSKHTISLAFSDRAFLKFKTKPRFKRAYRSYYISNKMNVGDKISYTEDNSPLHIDLTLTYFTSSQNPFPLQQSIDIYLKEIVGTKEWIGSKKSYNEIKSMGYSIDYATYIMVKYEKE